MARSATDARPFSLFCVALAAVASGTVFGAATNAVNGAVSPDYFFRVLQWADVMEERQVWRAAVAQGAVEGTVYGALFAVIFTLVVAVVSDARASFPFASKYLATAVLISLATWGLGGALGLGLAAFDPVYFQSTFRLAPLGYSDMLRFAWVGGSIWGDLFGSVLSGIIASALAASRWRQAHPVPGD